MLVGLRVSDIAPAWPRLTRRIARALTRGPGFSHRGIHSRRVWELNAGSVVGQLETVDIYSRMTVIHRSPFRQFDATNFRSWPIAEVTPLAVAAVKIVELLHCSERQLWAQVLPRAVHHRQAAMCQGTKPLAR